MKQKYRQLESKITQMIEDNRLFMKKIEEEQMSPYSRKNSRVLRILPSQKQNDCKARLRQTAAAWSHSDTLRETKYEQIESRAFDLRQSLKL